jgi:N-acetylmuramoyl-L-alanine amidase
MRTALAFWAILTLASPALAQGSQAGINVRVGYGVEATRVVVDSPVPVTGLREPSVSGEVNLMLQGPDAGVALQGDGHGLVRYWRLDAGEGGSRLTLTLAMKSQVVRTFLIPPGDQSTMYRYVIDLARSDGAPPKPTVIVATDPLTAKPPIEVAARKTALATSSDIHIPPTHGPEARQNTGVEVVAVARSPRRTARLVREPAEESKPATYAPAVHLSLAQRPHTQAVSALPRRETNATRDADKPDSVERPRPVHLALSQRKVIVIDAGHGGHDPGAQSDGTNEKDITLAAAMHLRHRLLLDGRYRVVMTRTSDVFVPLEERVRIARHAGADLFIALHADSAGDNDATHGASVYTLSGHGETRVKEVLNGHEWFDRATPRNDPAVKGILLDLTQRSTINRSNEFAQMLVGRLSEKIDVLPKTHRDAGYFVLLAPDVPAVLLEMGFITSPEDQARLTDPDRRNALMDTVADAIDEYFRGEVKVAEN